MKTLILALSLIVSSTSFAKNISYPAVIATQVSSQIVTFKHCYNEDTCRSIGNVDGYNIDDLNFNPRIKKAKAVLMGGGELAVGVVVGIFAGWAAWGVGLSGGVSWTIGTGAVVTTAPSLIDDLNPVLQWELANIQATIHKDVFDNEDQIVIEISDDIEMAEFIRELRMVLDNIE